MKFGKIVFFLFAFSLAVGLSLLGAFGMIKFMTPRIYLADSAEIRAKYYRTDEVNAELKKFVENANAQLTEMKKPIVANGEKIKEFRGRISAAKTDAEKKSISKESAPVVKEFMQQRELLEKFVKELRQKFSLKNREVNARLTKEIVEAVQSVAVKRHASYVFDKRGMFYGNLSRDISGDVVKLLNSRKDAKEAAAALRASKIKEPKRAEAPTAESLIKEHEAKLKDLEKIGEIPSL